MDHEHTLVLNNLNLFDGRQQLKANAIALRGERILALGDVADMPRGEYRDCQGAWALPGLIDAHVHLELNPDERNAPAGPQPEQIPLMAERAQRMLQAGITTARDLGGGAWYELALRDDIARGAAPGPRLLCSGQPITCPQGHCHFWGGEAANTAEAIDVLKRQVSKGVDLIKVMATGGRMTRGSTPTDAQFTLETLEAIVNSADQHGLTVAAHCHGTAGIELAAKAGVRTIEHCSWVGPQGWASDYQEPVAQIILEQGVWVSPTVNRGWQRFLDSNGKTLARVRAAYRAMLAMGIPFVASTDAGIPGVYHPDLPHALVVFGQIAQLTGAQTLTSATADAALALGIEDMTGTLAQGYAADLLLVDGNPLMDLTAVTRPLGVWARGRGARGTGLELSSAS